MFPRSNRFPDVKPSDIPGPGTYDVREPESTYKQGAFLDKAERFAKDKVSVDPGPSTDNDVAKPVRKATNPASLNDRYNSLQRKLDDLEQVHADSKKSNTLEQDRLRQNLAKAQKANTDQADQLAKLKRQNELLEARVQELKRASGSEQAELKDLRTKFRLLDHERAQLASKQDDAANVKKALESLDIQRRDELRERDQRIVELEKQLAAEKRRRETVETRWEDFQSRNQGAVAQAAANAKVLEERTRDAQLKASEAREVLMQLQDKAAVRENNILDQLQHIKRTLAQTALEYGRLVKSTVPAAHLAHVKRELVTSQLHQAKLERRLANTEDQVQELVHLVRHTQDTNTLLREQLRDAFSEAEFYAQVTHDYQTPTSHSLSISSLEHDYEVLRANSADSNAQSWSLISTYNSLDADALRLINERLRMMYVTVEYDVGVHRMELEQSQDVVEKAIAAKEEALRQLGSTQVECANAKSELTNVSNQLAMLQKSEEALKLHLKKLESQLKADALRHAEALQQEKTVARKLAINSQQIKSAQDILKNENEKLTAELMDAIQYQDAYSELLEEVQLLVARNTLAEEEVAQLSKFNAEIIGHHNSSQRIMYVERIRAELAETKQKLLVYIREHDALSAESQDLKAELDLYKSVAVPAGHKPRSGFTRVTRSVNARSQSTRIQEKGSDTGSPSTLSNSANESGHKEGDLTIDELL